MPFSFSFCLIYTDGNIAHYLLSLMPASSIRKADDEERWDKFDVAIDPDAEFGGSEARKLLEKKLLWKLDARMSILVVIYMLNCVSVFL